MVVVGLVGVWDGLWIEVGPQTHKRPAVEGRAFVGAGMLGVDEKTVESRGGTVRRMICDAIFRRRFFDGHGDPVVERLPEQFVGKPGHRHLSPQSLAVKRADHVVG